SGGVCAAAEEKSKLLTTRGCGCQQAQHDQPKCRGLRNSEHRPRLRNRRCAGGRRAEIRTPYVVVVLGVNGAKAFSPSYGIGDVHNAIVVEIAGLAVEILCDERGSAWGIRSG